MDPTGTYHGDSDLQLERINVYYNEATGGARPTVPAPAPAPALLRAVPCSRLPCSPFAGVGDPESGR